MNHVIMCVTKGGRAKNGIQRISTSNPRLMPSPSGLARARATPDEMSAKYTFVESN